MGGDARVEILAGRFCIGSVIELILWLWIGCLTPLSTTFQLYRSG